MNLDRFVAAHAPMWERLDEAARRDPASMSASEIRQLVGDYQRTATHLSTARTTLRDPELTLRLSQLVARAGATVHGTRPRSWQLVARFFTETFPAAMWHQRWPIGIASGIFLVVAFGLGAWTATSPAALDAAIPPAVQDALIAGDFVEYYSDRPSGQFFAEVGFNNIQVGFGAFAGGILACLPTVLLLGLNAANVGFAGGLFHANGVAEVFWGFITPHGLLELTAIFVAAGTGLALGWSWIDPGDRRRAESLQDQASRAITIVGGLIVVFGVAALIEGFVTGAPLPTWLRVGVGVLAEGAFLAFAWVYGRQAASRGLTGTLRQAERATWDGARA